MQFDKPNFELGSIDYIENLSKSLNTYSDSIYKSLELFDSILYTSEPYVYIRTLHEKLTHSSAKERLIYHVNMCKIILDSIPDDLSNILPEDAYNSILTMKSAIKKLSALVFKLQLFLSYTQDIHNDEITEDDKFRAGVIIDEIEINYEKFIEALYAFSTSPYLSALKQFKYVLFGM